MCDHVYVRLGRVCVYSGRDACVPEQTGVEIETKEPKAHFYRSLGDTIRGLNLKTLFGMVAKSPLRSREGWTCARFPDTLYATAYTEPKELVD